MLREQLWPLLKASSPRILEAWQDLLARVLRVLSLRKRLQDGARKDMERMSGGTSHTLDATEGSADDGKRLVSR